MSEIRSIEQRLIIAAGVALFLFDCYAVFDILRTGCEACHQQSTCNPCHHVDELPGLG